jgi:hypothetical protein
VECTKILSFGDYTETELRGYAKMKKIPGADKMRKKELVSALNKYSASAESKLVWREYLKQYRQDHPRIPYKEAVQRASQEYQKQKKRVLSI